MSAKPTRRGEGPAWRRCLRFWGSDADADVDDELRFHLEMRIQEYMARGLPPAEARRRAEARLGNVRRAREECIEIDERASESESRRAALHDVGSDARFAWRLLRRQWVTAILAMVCLALGIGLTTTMFSVADGMLVRPLPFGNGDRLYGVAEQVSGGRDIAVASYDDYLDWRDRQTSFAELAAMAPTTFPVLLAHPVRAASALVSANFFRTLGVTPLAGRLFRDGEDRIEAEPVAIVSRAFAERELGGVSGAIGKAIEVRGLPRTIVGVVADEHVLPTGGELWMPVPRDLHRGRGNRNLDVIGWLRPNVTVEQARSEMSRIEAGLAREYPRDDLGMTVRVTALRERYVGPAKPTLVAMLLATVLVLAVACANVAGIQLSRAAARSRELAVRTAIGASRVRLLRQLLTESVMLSMCGGLVGVFVAYQMSGIAGRSVLGRAPAWLTPSLDARVLGFALAISIVAGIAFGVVPAFRAARVDAADVLRGGRGAVGGGATRAQRAFVVVQVALSVVLLVSAGLSIESVRRLQRTPLGFDPHGVLVFNVTLQSGRYDEHPRDRVQFASSVLERARSLPGVAAAGATSLPPLRCCSQWQLHIDGRADVPGEKLMVTGNAVTPGYFEAMGIGLVRGRSFTRDDDVGQLPAMVINETFAKRFWPNENPVGHLVQDGNDHAVIVGVVRDVKQGAILDAPEPQFYRPLAQKPNTTLSFTVRSAAGDPAKLTGALRAIVQELDPTLPIYNVSTMEARVADALVSQRTFERLMLAFGVVALVLAAVGVFAVMSFLVEEHMREFGIRLALGAQPTQLVRLILRASGALGFVGSAIGLIGALAAGRWLSHILYGIAGTEPAILVIATTVLTAAALIAGFGPARRASRADPLEVLRGE